MDLLPEGPLEYCNFYKPLLVEELSLCDYPHQIHYGKCSIIGIVSRSCSKYGYYHLNSVTIETEERELQLPNGATNIIILDEVSLHQIPANGACEMFGEAVLYDSVDSTANVIPKTSKELVDELHEFLSIRADETELVEAMKSMAKRYLPAIKVFTLCVLEQARELIGMNLAVRCIKLQRK